MTALAETHDVGVFGLYSTPSDAGAETGGVAVRVSQRFTPDVLTQLGSRSLQWLRTPDGHPSDQWFSGPVLGELLELVDELGARLVVLESLWLQRYIDPLHERGCRVVLDAHGLEASLHEELADSHRSPLARRFAERTAQIEATAFAAADQIWIPSEREALIARERYAGELPLVVVPNVIEVDRYGAVASSDSCFRVIFPGAFGAPQNTAAARRLIARIFPLLRRAVENAHLMLVGRDPSADMLASAAECDRLEVTGAVADARPYLRAASAMAVPLSEGHGTRFKILEAFASSLPVVSTPKGIEGIDAEPGRHYLAAESDAEFVDALAQLARDPSLGTQVAGAAFELVSRRYSLKRVREIITRALVAESVQ